MSSGADTEVRAPATLGLDPANADLQTDVQRSGHGGPPPRRPVSGSTDGCPRLGAHWVLPMQGVWLPLGTRFGRSKRSGGSHGGSLFRKDLPVPCPHASLYYHSQSKRIEWSSRGSGTASRNPGRPHGPCVRGVAGLRLARGISHPHQTPSALCVVAIHRSGLFPAQVKAAFNPSVRSPVEARTLRIAAPLFESGVVHRFGCRDWCPAKTRLPGHPLCVSPHDASFAYPISHEFDAHSYQLRPPDILKPPFGTADQNRSGSSPPSPGWFHPTHFSAQTTESAILRRSEHLLHTIRRDLKPELASITIAFRKK